MSVLIKGMKMPENCTICRFCAPEADLGDGEMCMATGRFMPPCSTERLEECPLAEVPTPHGPLIDKDALLGHMKKTHDKWKIKGHYTPTTDDEIMTMNMPTIIEAEEGEEDE